MIGLYVNTKKSGAEELGALLLDRLNKNNVPCRMIDGCFDCNLDLIVSVGGDGTVLGVAESAAKLGIPVLSLNAGSVGFLSSFEASEIEQCAEFIAKGQYETDERPLIEFEIAGKSYCALNDVCIQRMYNESVNGCTLLLDLLIDNEFVDRFRADGIVIATPTGSTAYSLSAGGAVLTPKINAFIATPICAHTLRSKPIVYADNVCAEVGVFSDGVGVFCDGKFVGTLGFEQRLKIKKSNYSLKLVRGKKGFYETLFNKLTSWSGK